MRFGRKRRANRAGPEMYERLRQQVLQLTPSELGPASDGAPILALLMETGYAQAVATLVGAVDGSSSLYFSNGGGYLGAGAHATVAQANRRWLDVGVSFLPGLTPITDAPLPAKSVTQFVAVTPDGLRGASAPEAELGEGRHGLSQLFYAAQDVVTQIRLAQAEQPG